MSEQDKTKAAREFWVSEKKIDDGKFIALDSAWPDYHPQTHVIEYSEVERLRVRLDRAKVALKECIDELEHYAAARRDMTKEPLSEWHYVEIKHESDYEYYPNHVDKETIERFRHALAEIEKDER